MNVDMLLFFCSIKVDLFTLNDGKRNAGKTNLNKYYIFLSPQQSCLASRAQAPIYPPQTPSLPQYCEYFDQSSLLMIRGYYLGQR